MSPGTSSLAAKSDQAPSRLTRACGASLAFNAAMALSAWYSSQKPTTALASSSTMIMTKSDQWCTTADSTAAASIIQGIGPQK